MEITRVCLRVGQRSIESHIEHGKRTKQRDSTRWQTASLYATLTSNKSLTTVKDTLALGFYRIAMNNMPTHGHLADAQKRQLEQQVKDGMGASGMVQACDNDASVALEVPAFLVLCEHFGLVGFFGSQYLDVKMREN